MRRCNVHILQAGYCRHCEALSLRGGALRPIVFPALAGLILHPDHGPVLFDTGYDPAFFPATAPFPERLYRWATPPVIRAGDTVAAQLARFGLAPADIRLVILSHFHADHIAGLGQFPGARLLCSRAGLNAARQGSRFSAVRHGVLRALLPADFGRRTRFAEDCPRAALPADLAPFTEGADLLGDGSLLALDLPGHAPGQLGLALRDEAGRWHILAADAAWSCRAIRENRPPPAFITGLLGDTAAYRHTLHRLHLLSRRNADIVFTPSHCRERAPA
jgi:glyoxylase-like metal-dependent hydrolase (beta-lactamase superfamily II)